MPSTPKQIPQKLEAHPQQVPPPRARLEELLGRDFTEFLLDALSESHAYPGRRGSSSP
jgi:hypothetical protein